MQGNRKKNFGIFLISGQRTTSRRNPENSEGKIKWKGNTSRGFPLLVSEIPENGICP